MLPRDLLERMSASDGTDEHRCEVCGERFESGAALDRHVHEAGLVD